MKTVKIGIIGGGQLGKMMVLDAKRLGFYVVMLDPTPHCPAHSIVDQHIVADFDDAQAYMELASQVDLVTYEFEHIQVKTLEALENKGYQVYPSSHILKKIQNKYEQKKWLKDAGIPVPEFQAIDSIEAIKACGKKLQYPLVLKTCTGGYDGKGNYIISTENEVEVAYQTLGAGSVPLMVEAFIPYEKEISVLMTKGKNEEIAVYPVAENKHEDSILDETIVPARISEKVREKALQVAEEVAKLFSTRGMLCVELFVTKEGDIYVNELAPRPHNSGHYTIEGCITSQFEQHIRSVVGLPLGSTELFSPVVMKNIIGELNGDRTQVLGLENALSLSKVKVHLYEKEVRVGRKMGHITSLGDTMEEALFNCRKAHQLISYKG